jgi:hypothetical protein
VNTGIQNPGPRWYQTRFQPVPYPFDLWVIDQKEEKKRLINISKNFFFICLNLFRQAVIDGKTV